MHARTIGHSTRNLHIGFKSSIHHQLHSNKHVMIVDQSTSLGRRRLMEARPYSKSTGYIQKDENCVRVTDKQGNEQVVCDKIDMNPAPIQPHWHNMIAGSSAGVVCSLLFYPLEYAEAKMQLTKKGTKRKGLITTIKDTVKTEGFSALYKGVAPTVLGAAWNSAWYMSLYELFKHYVHIAWSEAPEVMANAGMVQYTSVEMIIAATLSGIICTFLSNPFYTLKYRMVTSPDNKGLVSMAKHMYKTEGIKSFWNGVVPSLFGVSEGAIQLVVYENLVRLFSTMIGDPSLASAIHFVAGSMSRAISTLLTYPYQVIRSRLMAHSSSYKGLIDCIQKTKEEGLSGFYGGLVPNLTRQLAPAGVFFAVYHIVKQLLASYL